MSYDDSAPLRRGALAVPILERDEAYMLAERWREHRDQAAADKMSMAHLRLVVSEARKLYKFRGRRVQLGDLIQEGCVGVMEALWRFKPEMGFQFGTYAKWWIKAAMQDWLLHSPIVRVGTSSQQKGLFFNLSRAMRRAGVLDSYDMKPDQIATVARYCGVRKEDVLTMLRCVAETVSLNASIGEDDRDAIQDLMPDEATLDPEEVCIEADEYEIHREALQKALRVLSERESYIIHARHLTEEKDVSTLEALGKKYGVSKERIRQIEKRALKKVTCAAQKALRARARASHVS